MRHQIHKLGFSTIPRQRNYELLINNYEALHDKRKRL